MDWGLVAWLLLIVFCGQVVTFAIVYLTRSAWQASPTGRAIAAFFGVIAVTLAGFIGLAMVPIPDWVFVVLFVVGNAVMFRLVRLLVRAQRVRSDQPNG